MDKLFILSWLRRAALLPALVLGFAGAAAAQQQEADPPGRVATLSHQVGSVVFAPDGEDEWIDLPLNRPLTRGDRVWTDRGARAQLHMGTTALHLDSEAHLAFFELDDHAAQLSLTQGSVNARVRDLQPRENMEIDTPNVAVRATEPGDYRVDVDPNEGTTRVIVRSGAVTVFGDGGESVRLVAGQQATFEGRDLRQVRGRLAATDDFDQWAADLNRREDQSIAARHIPRSVVGYHQLDNHGTWANEPEYGAVWYPRVTVADWAPYRHGRWEYIRPWGWTWVDDAPWGFAPFHYGRWARVGTRWCWVPGHFGPRPVYAPALVAFIGGSGFNVSFTFGSGPGIGWYPLAPGEAWWPTYRYSNTYLVSVNRHIVIHRRGDWVHTHRRHGDAITSVRVEDFNRGRRVRDHWRPVRPQDIANVQVTTTLPRPERGGHDRGDRGRDRPRLVATPPAVTTTTQPAWPGRTFTGTSRDERRETREERREERREVREERRDDRRDGREERRDDRREVQQRLVQEQQERAQREQREAAVRQQQERSAREQERAQREHERAAREQREHAVRQQQERLQREQERHQREAVVRQQQERAQREQERAVREQHRAQQERVQVERAQREQERAQREQFRAQREAQQQERVQRIQQRAQDEEGHRGRGRGRDDGDDDNRRGRGRNG